MLCCACSLRPAANFEAEARESCARDLAVLKDLGAFPGGLGAVATVSTVSEAECFRLLDIEVCRRIKS